MEILQWNKGDNPTVIATPHLESPVRSGRHWTCISSKSLMEFREDLESIAVVSRSRSRFCDAVRCHLLSQQQQRQRRSVEDFSVKEREQFAVVGKEVLERYGVVEQPNDSSSSSSEAVVGKKYNELISDFISLHGNDLMMVDDAVATDDDDNDGGEGEGGGEPNVYPMTTTEEENRLNTHDSSTSSCNHRRWKSVWKLIPSTPSSVFDWGSSSPSLISIISIYLHCKEGEGESHASDAFLMSFLARLVVFILDQLKNLLHQKKKKNVESGGSATTGKNVVRRSRCNSRLTSSDDDDDNDDGSVSRRCDEYKNGGGKTSSSVTKKVTVLLQLAKFLIAKIKDTVTKCSNPSSIQYFVRSNDLIDVTAMCVRASSGDGYCLKRGVGLGGVGGGDGGGFYQDTNLLKASLSLVGVVLERLNHDNSGKEGADQEQQQQQTIQGCSDNLLVSVFTILTRALLYERQLLPQLMRSTKQRGGDSRVGRTEHHRACLDRARHISTISLEIAGILAFLRIMEILGNRWLLRN